MNEQYEGINQFFAQGELEEEVRRRRAAPRRYRTARSGAARKSYPSRKVRLASVRPGGVRSGFVRPGLIRPGLIPPGLIRPGIVRPGILRPGVFPLWPPPKPVRPKFPIPLPIPGLFDPPPWRDPNRPPEPPRPAEPTPPPPASSSPPPPTGSPGSSPPPAPEPMDEPPDMTAGEPPPDDGEPPDERREPTEPGDAGTPNEEFLSLFSEYEYPSHEFGSGYGHTASCCGTPGPCTCGRGSNSPGLDPRASVLGLEELDTEFAAARYSEPELEYAEPASSMGELNEFFTPYAHQGGNYPGRRRGFGYRQRHPRFNPQTDFQRPEFEDEAAYEFETGKAAAPVVSSLATTKYGLRKGSRRSVPIFGVCVHTTGSGPATKAKKDPRRSALQRALDFYIKGSEGFPHYVVAYDGSIIATCDEKQIAWHAGIGKADRAKYKTWTAPKWWSSVWNPKGARSPLDLFPKGTVSANSAHIGVEMLADTTGYGFTDAQYTALAKLVVDISRRYKLPIASAPSARLLGHEDVHPLGRQNKGGGWDPGAHRDKPRFSWARVWRLIRAHP